MAKGYARNYLLPQGKAIAATPQNRRVMEQQRTQVELQIDSMPHEIDSAGRRGMELAVEQQALLKENDPASKKRLEELEKELAEERDDLAHGLPWLAIIGSVSPLLGLMGTVVGVMNSFIGITSQGSANIAAVAPGIAEALVATAAGLGAAIPAVMRQCGDLEVGAVRAILRRTEQAISERRHVGTVDAGLVADWQTRQRIV